MFFKFFTFLSKKFSNDLPLPKTGFTRLNNCFCKNLFLSLSLKFTFFLPSTFLSVKALPTLIAVKGISFLAFSINSGVANFCAADS